MTDKLSPYLVTVAVELRNAEDRKLFCSKLLEMAEAASFAFSFHVDGPTGQFLLKGTDEYQLSSVIGRIIGNSPIEVNVGAPQVEYRETITRAEKIDYTDKKKRVGGDVRVKLILEPTTPIINEKLNIDFVDGISKEFSRAIKQGVEWAFIKGPLGFPVLGIRVKLTMIDYRDNGPGFVQAVVHRAVKEALQHAKTCILEPFMKVEVVTPEKYRNDVIADLTSRRGRIDRQNENKLMVVASVPFANMFGYTSILKSLTGAEAKWTMSYSHYEPMPSPDDPAKQPAVIMRLANNSNQT